jgi:hypothetical protein
MEGDVKYLVTNSPSTASATTNDDARNDDINVSITFEEAFHKSVQMARSST